MDSPNVQPLEDVLAAALVGVLGLYRRPIGSLIAIGLWITYGLSMLPLLSKIAPIMIFVRKLALGLDLFSGALRFYLLRFDLPPA